MLSFRVRLILLVLAAVLPALGLILYTAAEQRRLATEQALGEAHLYALLAAADQGQAVEGARQVLLLLAALPEVHSADVARCEDLLARLLAQYPRYTNLTVIQPDGDVRCSAPVPQGPLNLTDRAYFQRAVDTQGFAAGDYVIGRISGKPSMDFAYPVDDPSGALELVIGAGLDLSTLSRSLIDEGWPEGATLTWFDPSGTIVARYPDSSLVGQSIRERPEFEYFNRERDGVLQATGLNGQPSLVGFASTGTSAQAAPLKVIVGIPEATAFALANRTLARNLVGLGLVALLALAAAWVGGVVIARSVAAVVRATVRMSAGDLSVRAGPPYGAGELGLLGRAFDYMAGELQTAYQATIQGEVVRQELGRARDIQARLLPRELAGWPGHLELAARFRPAREMSGDFYDVVPLGPPLDGDGAGPPPAAELVPLQIAVGDVAGKSIPAAFVMALARATLAMVAETSVRMVQESTVPSPADTLCLVSRRLHQDVGPRDFVACALAVVAPPARTGDVATLWLANAAQVPPILCRQGLARELEPPGERLPLGILPHAQYTDLRLELQPGDVVVFTSDGLPEAPAQTEADAVVARGEGPALATPATPGEMFGFDRLAASAVYWAGRVADAEALAAGIWADVNAWSGETSAHDDMTLVVLRMLPVA